MGKLEKADFGGEPEEIENSAGRHTYRQVTIDWKPPKVIAQDSALKVDADIKPSNGCLYVLFQNHGNMKRWDKIRYVGITNNVKARFADHHIVEKLRSQRNQLSLCIGEIDWGRYRTGWTDRTALEELEHLLIWMLWNDDFQNSRKVNTLPGMGSNGGRSWDIRCSGYKFKGQMPERIVYPWALAKYRQDRTLKL